MFPKITIVLKHDNGDQERFPALLTDEKHAMYKLNYDESNIALVRVVPTEDPDVYNVASMYLPLGKIEHDGQVQEMVKALKRKSAYDFLTDVMLNVHDEVNFKELIIPGFTKG